MTAPRNSRTAIATANSEPFAIIRSHNSQVAEKEAAYLAHSAELARLNARRSQVGQLLALGSRPNQKAVEAIILGLPVEAPSADELQNRLKLETEAAALPVAIANAEVDTINAKKELDRTIDDRRGAWWRFTYDQIETKCDELEPIRVKLLEKLAEMAAIELLKERHIGNAPISNIDPTKPVLNGRWAAVTTVVGIPARLRGPSLTVDAVFSRALEIANSINAQIME